jgi:hypothetical protein
MTNYRFNNDGSVSTGAATVHPDGTITRREDEGASSERSVCVKCGMPVVRNGVGWMHVLGPVSRADARKYRHVVMVAS